MTRPDEHTNDAEHVTQALVGDLLPLARSSAIRD